MGKGATEDELLAVRHLDIQYVNRKVKESR
jgi:hypothetical protein